MYEYVGKSVTRFGMYLTMNLYIKIQLFQKLNLSKICRDVVRGEMAGGACHKVVHTK